MAKTASDCTFADVSCRVQNGFKGKAGSKATARIFGTGASFKYVACFGLGAVDKPKAMRDLGSFATSSAKVHSLATPASTHPEKVRSLRLR